VAVTAKLAYSLPEAADAVSVSQDTLRRAIRAGDLPFRRVGVKYLIATADLLAWFESLPSEHAS
jgi:excisionase family DNA binding protein